MGDVEEATKAILELTMASSTAESSTTTTTTTTASSSSQAPSKKALKRELKMKHKEEKRGTKEEKAKKNKGFHMEEKVKMVKGPFEVRYGRANLDGVLVPYDQARVMLFEEYKEKAEAVYGHPISRAVIIIPPSVYDAHLHQMIKDAATTAGLDLKRIIVKGPNADQYPYGLPRRHGDPITTFDFSGSKYGTTVDYYQNIPELCFQATGTVYDNLLEQTVDYMKMAHGVDFTEDPSALQSLSEALERASVTNSKVKIKLPPADGDDPLTIRTVTL